MVPMTIRAPSFAGLDTLVEDATIALVKEGDAERHQRSRDVDALARLEAVDLIQHVALARLREKQHILAALDQFPRIVKLDVNRLDRVTPNAACNLMTHARCRMVYQPADMNPRS